MSIFMLLMASFPTIAFIGFCQWVREEQREAKVTAKLERDLWKLMMIAAERRDI